MASRTLTDTAWTGTRILAPEASEAVRDLKCTEDGDIGELGSGMLCRRLLVADLVDGIRLFIHLLLLGPGKRLFGELPARGPSRRH